MHTDKEVKIVPGNVLSDTLLVGTVSGVDQDGIPSPEFDPVNDDYTNNDAAIVGMYLYPEKGNIFPYSDLIGTVPEDERRQWDKKDQLRAEAGMLELLQVVVEPLRFKDEGLEGARLGVGRISSSSEPQAEHAREVLARHGRGVHYQTVLDDIKRLKHVGDFLHFGRSSLHGDAPDLLPTRAHIYVTPKPWAIGEVTAEVIRKARTQGYEPYGKVWDESSSEGKLLDRKDRVHFYPRAKSQVAIILNSLSEIQKEKPELFEEDPPILAAKTDIPGVGLAEELPQDEGYPISFTDSRLDLLQAAWDATLEEVMGPDTGDFYTIHSGQIVDARIRALQEAVKGGSISMDAVVQAYRTHIRSIAPSHGVSPKKISLNL